MEQIFYILFRWIFLQQWDLSAFPDRNLVFLCLLMFFKRRLSLSFHSGFSHPHQERSVFESCSCLNRICFEQWNNQSGNSVVHWVYARSIFWMLILGSTYWLELGYYSCQIPAVWRRIHNFLVMCSHRPKSCKLCFSSHGQFFNDPPGQSPSMFHKMQPMLSKQSNYEPSMQQKFWNTS